MSIRPISIEGHKYPGPALPGDLPALQWIDIALLVVDDEYQRPLVGAGKRNVYKIAANFRWCCFAPVIVCKTGDKYAIVDGQHRTTAARLVGIRKVPCQIIVGSVADQALAFKEINGATTKMSPLAIHAAAVAARDRDALKIEDAARRAGVTVLRYPVSAANQQEAGQTLAIRTLHECLKAYGRDTVVTALNCVTQTENNVPGMLVSPVIVGLCRLLGANKRWRDAGEKLLKAFDEIDLMHEVEAARAQAKPKGMTTAIAFGNRIEKTLAPLMAEPAQIAKAG